MMNNRERVLNAMNLEKVDRSPVILGANCTLPAAVDVNKFHWAIDKAISYTYRCNTQI